MALGNVVQRREGCDWPTRTLGDTVHLAGLVDPAAAARSHRGPHDLWEGPPALSTQAPGAAGEVEAGAPEPGAAPGSYPIRRWDWPEGQVQGRS